MEISIDGKIFYIRVRKLDDLIDDEDEWDTGGVVDSGYEVSESGDENGKFFYDDPEDRDIIMAEEEEGVDNCAEKLITPHCNYFGGANDSIPTSWGTIFEKRGEHANIPRNVDESSNYVLDEEFVGKDNIISKMEHFFEAQDFIADMGLSLVQVPPKIFVTVRDSEKTLVGQSL